MLRTESSPSWWVWCGVAILIGLGLTLFSTPFHESVVSAEPQLLDAVEPETSTPFPPEPADPAVGDPAPENSEVRSVIDRLLPNASAEERDIWYQQLKDLPPGIVEDLLQLRRQMPEAGASLISPTSPLTPQPLRQPQRLPTAESGAPSRASPTLDPTIRQLQRITRLNLLHLQTPGYLALVPQLATRGGASDVSEGGDLKLEYLGTRLSLTMGAVTPTDRPLDVAIHDGPAETLFFALDSPEGTLFTRYGRLDVDAQGRLAITFPGGCFPLTPEIRLPELAGGRLVIESRGQVLLWDRTYADQVEACGRIQLARFRDPSRLSYHPLGGLAANEQTGPATMVEAAPIHPESRPPTDNPPRWQLQTGALEGSNVRVDQETQRLAWLKQLEALFVDEDAPTDALPTAGENP
jgi:flagellar basal body rod protein FlgG